MSRPDAVLAALRESKSFGDVYRAVTQDPVLFAGLIVLLGITLFFLRVYLWPWINPLRFQPLSDLWKWLTAPRPPTSEETYPYAKVLYPTYR